MRFPGFQVCMTEKTSVSTPLSRTRLLLGTVETANCGPRAARCARASCGIARACAPSTHAERGPAECGGEAPPRPSTHNRGTCCTVEQVARCSPHFHPFFAACAYHRVYIFVCFNFDILPPAAGYPQPHSLSETYSPRINNNTLLSSATLHANFTNSPTRCTSERAVQILGPVTSCYSTLCFQTLCYPHPHSFHLPH